MQQTPPDFVFAVKASRYLTHVKRLLDIRDGIARFYDPLEPLVSSGKLGPVLWQLPENFHRDDERLEAWLELLPRGRHTIEFRHASWFVPEVMDRLRSSQVALTLGDHPERPFQTHEATSTWRFVRFHYGARGPTGTTPSPSSRSGAAPHRWRRTEEVYVYFNNDWNGYAPENARTLIRPASAGGDPASSTGSRSPPANSSRSKSSR